MPDVTRRRFVASLLGTAGLVGVSRAIGLSQAGNSAAGADVPAFDPLPGPPPPALRAPLPAGGELTKLPGGDLLALTLDDGADAEVVRRYTELARDTGVRMTFFVTGVHDSWRDNAVLLRPLVDSGQIQLGNHTWSHPDLTGLTPAAVAEELRRNDRFLRTTFGADATPYFRPPYGRHDRAVDDVAADLGYRVATLWSGSLGDSTELPGEQIVSQADRYFIQQNIVLGHLNHSPVTEVFPALLDIIRARRLRTVTLNDVFLQPEIPFSTS